MNGTAIEDPNTLRNLIASTPPGTEVTITIVRNGREQQMRVRLAELPTNKEVTEAEPHNDGSGDGHK